MQRRLAALHWRRSDGLTLEAVLTMARRAVGAAGQEFLDAAAPATYIPQEECLERVLKVVKEFPKVDPSKVRPAAAAPACLARAPRADARNLTPRARARHGVRRVRVLTSDCRPLAAGVSHGELHG